MGVFVRDIFLDQARADNLLYVCQGCTGSYLDVIGRCTLNLSCSRLRPCCAGCPAGSLNPTHARLLTCVCRACTGCR